MRRTQQPARPDTRASWQIAQGAACGCRGADDMCPCQNVEAGTQAPAIPAATIAAFVATLEARAERCREIGKRWTHADGIAVRAKGRALDEVAGHLRDVCGLSRQCPDAPSSEMA